MSQICKHRKTINQGGFQVVKCDLGRDLLSLRSILLKDVLLNRSCPTTDECILEIHEQPLCQFYEPSN